MGDYLKERERERKLEQIRGKRQLRLPGGKAVHKAQLGFGFNGDGDGFDQARAKEATAPQSTAAALSSLRAELERSGPPGLTAIDAQRYLRSAVVPSGSRTGYNPGDDQQERNRLGWLRDHGFMREVFHDEAGIHFFQTTDAGKEVIGKPSTWKALRDEPSAPKKKPPSKAELLAYMKKSGQKLTTSELAYAFRVSPQAAAGLLQRLVAAGELEVATAPPGRQRVSRSDLYQLPPKRQPAVKVPVMAGGGKPTMLELKVLGHARREDRRVPGVLLAPSRVSDDLFADERTAADDQQVRMAMLRLKAAGYLARVKQPKGHEPRYKLAAPKAKKKATKKKQGTGGAPRPTASKPMRGNQNE